MVNHRSFPYQSYPSGWFQVAWADEVTAVPRSLRYFGQDLVVYRGASGDVHLFNAICPHMGAHLGYGGKTDGDSITCPYHGWSFDSSGKNCDIPYAERPNKTKIKKWQVAELGTMVLAWHDELGRSPWFEPFDVPEFSNAATHLASPVTRRNYESVYLKPQFIADNLVDAAHQKYVHRAADIPDITSYASDGGRYAVDYSMTFGKGKKTTWLTPDGKPIVAAIRIEAAGIGMSIARFEIDGGVHIQSTTPVDHERCDSRHTVIVPISQVKDGEPDENAVRRFQHELVQFERDLLIWEHQEFMHPVPYPMLERDRFRSFRNWSAQFYPDGIPGHFGKLRPDDQEVPRLIATNSA
jgi:3-ketosteroid 9alpha-monooxygenase subunit A